MSGIFLEEGTATEFRKTELGEGILIGGKLAVFPIERQTDKAWHISIEAPVFLVFRIVVLLLALLVQVFYCQIERDAGEVVLVNESEWFADAEDNLPFHLSLRTKGDMLFCRITGGSTHEERQQTLILLVNLVKHQL